MSRKKRWMSKSERHRQKQRQLERFAEVTAARAGIIRTVALSDPPLRASEMLSGTRFRVVH